MSKTIAVALLALFLSGCTMLDQLQQPIGRPLQGTPTPGQTVQASATIEVSTPTVTPWPNETPTSDTWLTQVFVDQEHDDKQLTISNNSLTLAAISGDERKTNVVLHNTGLTQVKEGDDARGTQLVILLELDRLHATGTIDGQNFIRELPTIHVAMTQTGYTALRDLTGVFFEWLVIAVAIALVSVIVYVVIFSPHGTKRKPITKPVNATASQPDSGRIINKVSGTTNYPGLLQIEIPEKLATDQQLEWLANGIIRDGKPLSHGAWTPKWQNGFSEPGFKALQYFFADPHVGFATWNNPGDTNAGQTRTPAFDAHFKKLVTDGPSGPEPEGEEPPYEELAAPSPTERDLILDVGFQPIKK